MRLKVAFLIGLIGSFVCGSSAQSEGVKKWQSLPEFSCQASEQDCYFRAARVLEELFFEYKSYSNTNSFDEDIEGKMPVDELKGIGRYLLMNKKSKEVFVIVHGLYANDLQFRSLAFYLRYKLSKNVIHLVLPGHGRDIQNSPFVTTEDWRHEVSKAVDLARYLGQKVILFGQSTGGMLSIIEAIKNPKKVDGLMVMEPALKVNQPIPSVTCLENSISNKRFFRDVLEHSETYSGEVTEHDSFHMGCLVSKLRSDLLRELGLPDEIRILNMVSNLNSGSILNSEKIGERIPVPTLVLNQRFDLVVDYEENKAFAKPIVRKGLGKEIVIFTSLGHGAYNFTHKHRFYKFFEDYLIDNFP